MDKIEEVKKNKLDNILERLITDFKFKNAGLAEKIQYREEICQLFEPKPDEPLYKQFPTKKRRKEVQCEPYQPA